MSRDGGYTPVWRRDGKQLAYVGANDRVVVVDLTTTNNQVTAGIPRPLFRMPVFFQGFPRLEMSADAQRFLVKRPLRDAGSGAITVVMNWQTTLDDRPD